MKTFYFVLSLIAVLLFSSFVSSEDCEYVGSNINYVRSETKNAIDANELGRLKFYSYRALKSIYKSEKQLKDCGCAQASITINESRLQLKDVVKSQSLPEARTLLKEVLSNLLVAMASLEQHDLHEQTEVGKELAMNVADKGDAVARFDLDDIAIRKKIDLSLINYRVSLQKVVDSVNCDDARVFAKRIFDHCEQELLKPNLSEGKKYYNLKTKQITAKALDNLGNCDNSE